MNRETIENKAREQAEIYMVEAPYQSGPLGSYRKGFIEGADWRINSVWHDATEKPDNNQLVVFECRKTYGRGYSVNFGENYDLLKNVVLKWAYVIDLLPERKEEKRWH